MLKVLVTREMKQVRARQIVSHQYSTDHHAIRKMEYRDMDLMIAMWYVLRQLLGFCANMSRCSNRLV
jgi:hypothetical protein